jgi:tripartite-type tricarboxylate transporter receptor subunit TctC
MKNGTPHALDAVAIAIALLMLATPALAQVREFPAKPLRIIVPTAPGGSSTW